MNIRDKIIEFVAEAADVAQSAISDNSKLVDDLNVDSPRLLEIVVAIEQELGIKLSDRKLAGMVTVGDIITHVQSVKKA